MKQKIMDGLFHLAWIALIGVFLWAFTVGMSVEPQHHGTGGGGAFMISPHATCDILCQIILGYVIAKTLDATGKWLANDGCANGCGGGGGGGFGSTGCDPNSADICHTEMNTN